MITDSETNFVYFSDRIRSDTKYTSFWNSLEPILKDNNIEFDFIYGTKDIWCRDYMPIQTDENNFVQFRYLPDYLVMEPKYKSRITLPHDYSVKHKLNTHFSDLIIDGGNIVKSKNAAILTNKIFLENPNHDQDEIRSLLREILSVEDVFIIPVFSDDISGHADGMVRFCNDDTLLVSDCSKFLKEKLKPYLDQTGLKIEYFPAVICNEKNEEGDYTAKGIYINFAQVGKNILLPQFDLPEQDALALAFAKKAYFDCNVIPVNSNSIAKGGGVLNCITWNIKTPSSLA